MDIAFCNSNDKRYQQQLNHLLKPIFLDFQFWYDLNLWDNRYESYSIMQNNEIISNVCVFKANVLLRGRTYAALSVGAVATKDGYRGKGYSRLLMEHIIHKYDNVPMYLSANETVMDFYPRFGFRRIYDKLAVAEYAIHNAAEPKKLCCNDPKVRDHVVHRMNFSQDFDCLNTECVNLFHICGGYLKDCIYDIPELDTVVVAQQNDTVLKIIGVFSLRNIRFADLAKHLPFTSIERIEFGFMPCWDDVAYRMIAYETKDPLFVRGLHCDIGDFKFPALSIT